MRLERVFEKPELISEFRQYKENYQRQLDIDIDDDGAMELYSDLISLAETSTSWELVCNRELKGKLSVLPSSVSTYYVKCQKFDEILTKIY